MGNEFTNSEIRFTVICQATQVTGNSDSPITAVGWPPETVEGDDADATESGENSEEGSTTDIVD